MATSLNLAGKAVAASVLAFAGLMTTGVGISRADTIQTEGNYPTHEACQNAGPGVKATTPGNWNNFWCVPDARNGGNWRLVLSN
ncbi:hypothetical protein [Mycobacterium sp.]|uniref:hypothetical protein n=1 Tax=Mycobacterium sp. TaxID=1785 RepID=UPI0025D80B0B|nr:hypothetical protein [Mycobacterium sp.]MBW0012438.1 hypothetical protein [Mycobacterium sp.]